MFAVASRSSKRRASCELLGNPEPSMRALRPAEFRQPPIVPAAASLLQGQAVQFCGVAEQYGSIDFTS